MCEKKGEAFGFRGDLSKKEKGTRSGGIGRRGREKKKVIEEREGERDTSLRGETGEVFGALENIWEP